MNNTVPRVRAPRRGHPNQLRKVTESYKKMGKPEPGQKKNYFLFITATIPVTTASAQRTVTGENGEYVVFFGT
jgi:hypothetical protein